MFKALAYLFYTECLIQCRRSQQWLFPLGFFLIVITLYPISITGDLALLQKFFPGFVWITALLASLLSINSFFLNELEDQNIEQLMVVNTPLSLIILVKLIAEWCMTQFPLIMTVPFLSFLFNANLNTAFILMITLLIGTPILTAVSALAIALTLGLKQQGVLLGLIILPIMTPVLIFGVMITELFQNGFNILAPLLFLSGLMILALLLLPFAISACVKVYLEEC